MSIEYPATLFHFLLTNDYCEYDFPNDLKQAAEKAFKDGSAFLDEYTDMQIKIADGVKKEEGWFKPKYKNEDLIALCESKLKELNLTSLDATKSLYLAFFLKGFDSSFAELFIPLLLGGAASSEIINKTKFLNGNPYTIKLSQKISILTVSYWRLMYQPEFYLFQDYHKGKEIRDIDNRNKKHKIFFKIFEKHFYAKLQVVITNMANNLKQDILFLDNDPQNINEKQTELRLCFLKNKILTPRNSLPMLTELVIWEDKCGMVLYDFFNGDSLSPDINLNKIHIILSKCGVEYKEIHSLGDSGALFIEFDIENNGVVDNLSLAFSQNITNFNVLMKSM